VFVGLCLFLGLERLGERAGVCVDWVGGVGVEIIGLGRAFLGG
jgi:hypothetical protein